MSSYHRLLNLPWSEYVLGLPVECHSSTFTGSTDKYMAYGSLFLSVPGVYATIPMLSAWMANNSEPHYRRATSIALGFIATNAISVSF